mmetsp:Transcript_27974/g.59826  ORF Transcript_27974/g.59826 Transcript_27974/m.59826 type:complete len:248 (-) Transcript_27974:1332-2075(-)
MTTTRLIFIFVHPSLPQNPYRLTSTTTKPTTKSVRKTLIDNPSHPQCSCFNNTNPNGIVPATNAAIIANRSILPSTHFSILGNVSHAAMLAYAPPAMAITTPTVSSLGFPAATTIPPKVTLNPERKLTTQAWRKVRPAYSTRRKKSANSWGSSWRMVTRRMERKVGPGHWRRAAVTKIPSAKLQRKSPVMMERMRDLSRRVLGWRGVGTMAVSVCAELFRGASEGVFGFLFSSSWSAMGMAVTETPT